MGKNGSLQNGTADGQKVNAKVEALLLDNVTLLAQIEPAFLPPAREWAKVWWPDSALAAA
jgi:hypothetical protein